MEQTGFSTEAEMGDGASRRPLSPDVCDVVRLLTVVAFLVICTIVGVVQFIDCLR